MPRLGQVVTLAIQFGGVEYVARLNWIAPNGTEHWHLAGEDCDPPINDYDTLHAVYGLALEKVEGME